MQNSRYFELLQDNQRTPFSTKKQTTKQNNQKIIIYLLYIFI